MEKLYLGVDLHKEELLGDRPRRGRSRTGIAAAGDREVGAAGIFRSGVPPERSTSSLPRWICAALVFDTLLDAVR